MCSIYKNMPQLRGIGMVSEPMLMEYKKWLMDRMGMGAWCYAVMKLKKSGGLIFAQNVRNKYVIITSS